MPSEVPPETFHGNADELRRIAFGRASTAQERLAASERLAALNAVDSAPAASLDDDSDAAVELIVDAVVTESPTEPTRHRRTIALAWLMPIILVSLALGAVGGQLWNPGVDGPRSAASPTPPVDSPIAPDVSEIAGGDPTAAAAELNRPATDEDNYPHLSLVEDLRQSSVRYLGGSQETVRRWAGRNVQDGFCLLASEGPQNLGAATCATPEDFAAQGIGFGVNGYQVFWNGRYFSISGPGA